MKLDLKFKENVQRLDLNFGQFQDLTDGGYERGYAAGYEKGNAEGYANGLAERQYEIWTITLADGTIVEKEVALL